MGGGSAGGRGGRGGQEGGVARKEPGSVPATNTPLDPGRDVSTCHVSGVGRGGRCQPSRKDRRDE